MRQEANKPAGKIDEESPWRWEEWIERMGKVPRFLQVDEMRPPERRSFSFRDDATD